MFGVTSRFRREAEKSHFWFLRLYRQTIESVFSANAKKKKIKTDSRPRIEWLS
jgi:hypothetical protein